MFKVNIVLWNDQTDFDCKEADVVVIKNGNINVYNQEKNVSLYHSSMIIKGLKNAESVK